MQEKGGISVVAETPPEDVTVAWATWLPTTIPHPTSKSIKKTFFETFFLFINTQVFS